MLTCPSDSLTSEVISRNVYLCYVTMDDPLTHLSCMDRDINSVIMDYLINEGYPSAARKFALEANIQPKADMDSIQERLEIRNAIHGGDIQSAIEKINELNPTVSLGALS